jgi:choline dehydrogenase-like flavoprotein
MIGEGIEGLAGRRHDVVVVGAGPLGISLSLQLARAGRKVLLLESGTTEPTAERQELSRGTVVDPRVHDELEIAMSRQLGGTSNLWGARCQPFDPIDFADRRAFVGADWPIDYAEIAPYYAAACAYANCGEAVFRAPHPALDACDAAVDATRTERFSAAPAFQKAHALELAEHAALEVRLGVTVSGLMMTDGSIVALTLNDLDGKLLNLAVDRVVLAMGGLETTRLLLAAQRQYPELGGGPGGALGKYYMAHVIGEVADITWRDRSIDAAYDFFLDGLGSYARRRMIPADDAIIAKDLPNISFWPVVAPVADARHRNALLSLVFLALATPPIGRRLVAEAIRRYHAPRGIAKWPHIRNVLGGWPSAIAQALGFLHRRYRVKPAIPGFFVRSAGMTYGLSYHAEHLPAADSRVVLGDETDRYGLPRLKVDLRFSQADAEAVLRAHLHLQEWLQRNGIGELRFRQPVDQTAQAILDTATHGNHQIGLARMAAGRESGVVSRDLEVFGARGLFVASVAVLPTSGQANPTLTGVAFALRLADYLDVVIARSA